VSIGSLAWLLALYQGSTAYENGECDSVGYPLEAIVLAITILRGVASQLLYSSVYSKLLTNQWLTFFCTAVACSHVLRISLYIAVRLIGMQINEDLCPHSGIWRAIPPATSLLFRVNQLRFYGFTATKDDNIVTKMHSSLREKAGASAAPAGGPPACSSTACKPQAADEKLVEEMKTRQASLAAAVQSIGIDVVSATVSQAFAMSNSNQLRRRFLLLEFLDVLIITIAFSLIATHTTECSYVISTFEIIFLLAFCAVDSLSEFFFSAHPAVFRSNRRWWYVIKMLSSVVMFISIVLWYATGPQFLLDSCPYVSFSARALEAATILVPPIVQARVMLRFRVKREDAESGDEKDHVVVASAAPATGSLEDVPAVHMYTLESTPRPDQEAAV